MEAPKHENTVLVFYPHILSEQCTTANYEDGNWYDYRGNKINTELYKINRWEEISNL